MARYIIKLTKEEVEELYAIVSKGSHTAQKYKAAYILLNCDQGEYGDKSTNQQISKILKVGMRTIDRVKKRFVEEGIESLERRPTTRKYEIKVDGDVVKFASPRQASDAGIGTVYQDLALNNLTSVTLNFFLGFSLVRIGSFNLTVLP